MKRAGIYVRVSTAEQHHQMQLNELRGYCEARGWTIVTEYADCISGFTERRPQLDQLMKDAQARKVDIVVIWKLDRFARSLKHLVNALAEFESLGVAFVSMRDNLDLGTPAGRLMFQIVGAMAEFERNLIVERVNAGLAHAREKGIVLGRPKLTCPENMSRTTLWRRAKAANVANATA